MTIQQQLRECAKSQPDPMNPHWVDNARMLMNWAADAIDAADEALLANKKAREIMKKIIEK